MKYTVPHYYSRFHCTASECPDTCCAGWEIVIDGRSLRKYERVEGAFGNRLHNSVDWRRHAFRQYGRRCAFLNEENLCDLYEEAGEGMLCETCRQYPRHTEEFEGSREISLSLSCPEAAKVILGCREPVRFLTWEREGEEKYPEFDFFLYTKILEAREVIFRILQNRDLDCRLRMTMVLALSRDLQNRIDGKRLCRTAELLERYGRAEAPERFARVLEKAREQWRSGREGKPVKRYEVMCRMFRRVARLEVLDEGWPDYAGDFRQRLYGEGAAAYEEKRRRFLEEVQEREDRGNAWALWCEQLMVYFVFTYFGGAVYDGRVYEKMKLAVFGTLFLLEMGMAARLEKGVDLTLEEFADIAHRYSKETEHSESNLKCLEQWFRKGSGFSLEALMTAILD